MKTWIVSSLDEETIQGRKLSKEIRYLVVFLDTGCNEVALEMIKPSDH